jgi:lysophospholipid acyltransferase
MTGQRYLYYQAWKLGEAACIASGLAYSGWDKKSGNPKWEGVVSLDIAGVELETSCNPMVKSWNHTVHLWLNRYVFERTVPHGKRPTMANNLIVYMVSAFWHGFYPAYYIMFFQLTFLAEVTKDIYKMRSRFYFIPWPINMLLSNFITFLFMNYQGVCFCSLGLEESWNLAKNSGFYYYLVVFPAFFCTRILGVGAIRTPREKKE